MKYIYILFITLAVKSLFAQITITQSDMPSNGDTIRYSTSTDFTTDFSPTGANYTWDYSSLTSSGQDMYQFKSPLSINPIYILPFGLSSIGLKISDGFGGGPVTLSNIYNFFNKSSTKYAIRGYGAEVGGIPLPSTYSDEDEYYQFPLDYNDADTSTFDVQINIPTIGNIRMTGERINIAEGWGTIMTPYDTVSALKVKTFVNEIDSINISFLPFPIGIPRNTISYRWLTNTEKMPILEASGTIVAGTFVPNQIRYRDRFNESAVPFTPIANVSVASTTVTMSDTVLLTNRTTPPLPDNIYRWNITPTTFTYVNGTDENSEDPEVKFNATGYYTVKLTATIPPITSAGISVTDDTTAVNYIYVRDFGVSVQQINTQETIAIYPNPAQDIIQFNRWNEIATYTLTDISGKIIVQGNTLFDNQQKVGDLSAGTYFVNLTLLDKSSHVLRFVKK